MHPDIVVRYPQSGEVIRGKERYVGMLSAYPGETPEVELEPVRGGEETVEVSSPLPFGLPTITVVGGGNLFFVEAIARYPDGSVFNTASLIKVQDRLVIVEISYFAAPFEAPAWRRPFVED